MKQKIFILLFLASATTSISHGQVQAGLVFGAQVPAGNFNGPFGPGPGFGATGKYALDDKMSVGANLHYNAFSGNRYHDPYYNEDWRNRASITAFTGLFEYSFSTEKLKPYLGADLGFYFWSWKYYYNYWYNPAGNPRYDYHRANGTELGFAPCGGIYYDISDQLVLNANMKFHLMITSSGLNYMGINVGLFYKFDK